MVKKSKYPYFFVSERRSMTNDEQDFSDLRDSVGSLIIEIFSREPEIMTVLEKIIP